MAGPPSSPSTSSPAALDRFFESYYRLRPVNATFTGIHEYDSVLPDWSPEGLDTATAEMRGLRRQLAPHLSGAGAVRADDLDVTLADAFLDIQLEEFGGTHFQRANPALFTGEAAFSIVSLMLRPFAPAEDRTKGMVGRLDRIPRFLAEAAQTIDRRPVPEMWLARALDEVEGLSQLLTRGIPTWCRTHAVAAARSDALERAASSALAGVATFGRWLRSHPTAPPGDCGVGPDFFDLLLRRGHCCPRSRPDLLGETRERLARARARLHEMAGDFGGWATVQATLADRHSGEADYLETFGRTWQACRQTATDNDLVTWPDSPIRYVAMPGWARAAAPHLYFLHYRSPAPFDGRGAVDYLAPPIPEVDDPAERRRALQATNQSVIKLNHVIHHGAIGHHVQNHYASQSPSRIGQVAAVDGASRIGMFGGGTMAEGWACYVVDLMEEVGFLDPLESVAQQHSRVRLLARAVVDIALHQHDMSEHDAVQFHHDRGGMNLRAARREVVRTSMFPGTAIMYWLGSSGLHALRAARRAQEGEAFSLRTFHDRVLHFGSIPVPLMSDLMASQPARRHVR